MRDSLIDPDTITLYDDDAKSCESKGHNVKCVSSYKIGRYLWKNEYVCQTCGNEWYEEDEEDVG